MVKAYLRYEPAGSFGVVASADANTIYDSTGRFAIAPALEDVVVWDLKKGTEVSRWHEGDLNTKVTCICSSSAGTTFAVGYDDGSIRIWDAKEANVVVTLNGHRSAVTALTYDTDGSHLASGSRDTDLIVWDVVAETGLYRLRGHKDQITCVRFLKQHRQNTEDGMDEEAASASSAQYLLSSSKDTLLKLWDLTTQHCIETVVAHRSETWAFDVNPTQDIIVTGGADKELRVWKIDWHTLSSNLPIASTNTANVKDVDMDGDEQGPQADKIKRVITLYGPLARTSNDHVVTIRFHPSNLFVGVQAADRLLEIYRIRSHEEIKKKKARRKRRQREKMEKKGTTENGPTVEEDEIKVDDEFTAHHLIRTPAKLRSFDFAPEENLNRLDQIRVLVSLLNNTLETYTVPMPKSKKNEEEGDLAEPLKQYVVDLPGHRTDIRTLALSGDDELVCSGSSNMLKVWNVKSSQCIRSMECGYALCSAFLPGNRHIIVGTKSGELQLFDLASSTLLESISAHEGPVYSLQVRPDKRGLVTGSGDKEVKFWDFDMVSTGKSTPKRLTLTHMRTLKMSDEVLCVRYSPDQNLIAVALLDTTVKVFYHDTLKFYLSMYGHKLPVLSMDISSDNTLLVTCSADKNVKLWGLDFGDCHKSIFAHQESIMQVQFVWGTHYFFTAGKDRLVKYWDGDKFENIMKLPGHFGEVWTLAIAKHGLFVVSASQDRSIRVWERTEEQLFLEEEREKELDTLYEQSLSGQMERAAITETGEDGQGEEVGAAGKETLETLKAGEKLMEALDLAESEAVAWEAYETAKARNLPAQPPQPNAILQALQCPAPTHYVLKTLQSIRPNDLDSSLLVLPFSKIQLLLGHLNTWAQSPWAPLVMVSRVLFFILKQHHAQIASQRTMRVILDSVRVHLRQRLQDEKDKMGFNLAGLKILRNEWKDRNVTEFGEAPVDTSSEKKRKFIGITT